MPAEKENKILFHQVYEPLILAGQKTQSRRAGERFYTVGQELDAFVTETGKPFAKLKVIKVFKQTYADMSDEEGRLDGFKDKADFWSSFVKIYPDITVEDAFTAIEFKIINT